MLYCKKKLIALVAFFSISIFMTGCGIYRDFTTYFNTYYNAKTLFERTEEEILKQRKDIFAFREEIQGNKNSLPSSQTTQQFGGELRNRNQFGNQQFATQSSSQFATGNLSTGNINQDLTKVIEKCSKILQYEKESSYFPDALFMAGKALYYQQEFSKAQRKFLELAGLNNKKYSTINKLWLAKTQLQLREFEDGLKLLEEVKKEALEKDEIETFNEASITKISFLIYREQLVQAISECQDFLKNSEDDEMKALVANQMGIIYQKIGDDKNALDAFASVINYEPTFEVELQSRLQHARLLKKLNRIDESEEELSTMKDQGKFKNNLDEIFIDLAQIYFEKGKHERAVDLLKYVDSTYKQLPTSGIASLKLGEVYEKGIQDYDSAYKYYNRASSSLAPREVKLSAGAKSKNFERYFFLKKELQDFSTQLEYILNPKNFIRDSIDYAIAEKEYQDETKKLFEQSSSSSNFGNDAQAQESLRQQQLLIQQQKQKLLLEKSRTKSNESIPLKDLIALGKAKKPVRPTTDSTGITTAIAANYFNQGSLFYSEFENYDSAFVYFNKVLKDYNDKPIVPQTLFALATYYDTKKDTSQADSLYKIIVNKYPKDKLYEPAAIRLGLIKKENKKKDVVSDDAAKPFSIAEELFFQKKYNEAIDSFKVIAIKFPKSRYAAKSLYFAGMIYEENLKNYDSAAVAYGILAKNFALEPLAKNAIAKYDEYKKEKERIQKEAEEKKKTEELKKKEEEKSKSEVEKSIEQKNQINIEDKKVAEDSLNDEAKPRTKKSYLDRLKAEMDSSKKANDNTMKLDSTKKKIPIPD